MTRPRSFAVALALWLLAAARVAAETNPLDVIPDNALGVVVINRLDDTNARIQKLTEKMKLPVPDLLSMAQNFSGVQQGLDTKGTIAAAAFPDEHEDAPLGMAIAVFVPVSDYKAFITQLQPKDADAAISEVQVFGSPYLAAKKGDFAVFCSAERKYVIEQVLASSKAVTANLDTLKPWLNDQQAALAITPAGKKLITDKLEELLQNASKSFEAAAANVNNETDEQAKKLAETARANVTQLLEAGKLLTAAIKAEVTQFGVGIRIDDKTAFHLALRADFLPDGALAKWSAGVQAPERGLLAGLPPSKFVIAYGGVLADINPSVMNIVDRLALNGLQVFGLDQEQQKKYLQVMAARRANVLRVNGLMGQLRPGESIMATAMSLEQVKDPQVHLKVTRDMFDLLKQATVKNDGQKKPVYQISDVMVGEIKATEVSVDLSAMLESMPQQAGMAERMQSFFSKMFGKDGVMKMYVTSVDKTVVSAYSKELLQLAVSHLRSGAAGLEADAQIASVDSLLPKGSQWAAYVNPQGLLQWIDLILREILPPQANFKIPPFPPSEPIGLAGRVAKSGLDAELVLPESVVAGIGQYIGIVQQMLQGGGAPLP